MEAQEAAEAMEHEHGTPFKSKAALQISVLALILAIGNLGGANSTKSASEHDLAASNMYAFYQSKSVKQTQYKLATDQLEIQLASAEKLSQPAREVIEKKVADYKKSIERYESEPDSGEGKKELMAKARALEAERDAVRKSGPWMTFSGMAYQIGRAHV